VNAAYLELHVRFVRDRLKRAGIRLGRVLDTTLGQCQCAIDEFLLIRQSQDSRAA